MSNDNPDSAPRRPLSTGEGGGEAAGDLAGRDEASGAGTLPRPARPRGRPADLLGTAHDRRRRDSRAARDTARETLHDIAAAETSNPDHARAAEFLRQFQSEPEVAISELVLIELCGLLRNPGFDEVWNPLA
jgi:hypothetical protein